MAIQATTRISVSRDALVAALGLLTRIIERRGTVPILLNILVEVKGGLCLLTATDQNVLWATTSIALGDALTPDASTTLPAQMLSDIVRKLPSGAELDLTWGEKEANIACGKAKYRLNTLPAEDYPSIPEPEWQATFSIEAKQLHQLFEKVAFAIARDEVRWFLNGAFLHIVDEGGESRLVSVATDGHRLSKVTVPAPDKSGSMPGVIVPQKTVGEFIRLLDGRDGEVEVSVCDAKFAVKAGPTRLLSKLIEGTFPDYAHLIPKEGLRTAIIDADALASAADRVSTVVGERSKGVKLSFEGSMLRLEVRNPDAGDAEEEVQTEFEGEPLEIGFNARYLAEALRAIAADTIRVLLGNPNDQAVMTSTASSDHLVLIMPLKV